MEFSDKRILRIHESKENFTDIAIEKSFSMDIKGSSELIRLFNELKENIWGCDLLLCLFITALSSYRTDHCLRPFPPFYINEEGKDFNSLRKTCDSIPPLKTLLAEPQKCSEEIAQLLTWLFLDKRYPVLKRIGFSTVPFPSKLSKIFRPHYVFEICYQQKIEDAWQNRKGDREIILAYHGSVVDNFYSILKVGLQQHFSFEKELLFGKGIYLSNEVSVSAYYAPFSQTWKNSVLGSKLSIIAICEIINDVNKVKCKDSKNKQRSINEDGLGDIPEKYFVVTDSDMVRVKYLMVYREKTAFSVKSYLVDNLFWTLLVMYFILIILIGGFNNLSFYRWFTQTFSFK